MAEPAGPPPPPALASSRLVWHDPPQVDRSGEIVRSIYRTDITPVRFDADLIDALNAEYKDRPLVPNPPRYDAASLTANARKRLAWVHNAIDLAGQTTLEIGCGNGFEVWHVADTFGADAHGVDVQEYGPWSQLAGDRVHFACADLAEHRPYPEDTFDRVFSITVWEHILHPYAMLEETFRVLKPGGLAWIRANLFPGPMASHRYREILFPWPHLLFSDDVVREWDERHGHQHRGHAWVNRLSWWHYREYFDRIGFRLRHHEFTEARFDEPFYRRFEDVLGRYPRWDLGKDFFTAILEKPAR